MRKIILGLLCFICVSAYASENSPKSTIKRLISYSNVVNGDLYVSLANNGSSCANGYFLNVDDKGFKVISSMLLAAYHANSIIHIDGITTVKWSGSSANVCKIYDVEYIK